MKLLPLILILVTSQPLWAQHKLNLPKAPREYNEDRETGILLGASVLSVGFVGAATSKQAAPVALPVAGLGVAVCMTIYSRRWKNPRL